MIFVGKGRFNLYWKYNNKFSWQSNKLCQQIFSNIATKCIAYCNTFRTFLSEMPKIKFNLHNMLFIFWYIGAFKLDWIIVVLCLWRILSHFYYYISGFWHCLLKLNCFISFWKAINVSPHFYCCSSCGFYLFHGICIINTT